MPKALQKIDFSGLAAEVVVSCIGTFPLDVDLDGNGKCGAIGVCGTIPALPVGTHTFTVNYFLNDLKGVRTLVATATTTQEISADATTPIIFPALSKPDDDGDGFTNLKEIELGSDPKDVKSVPPVGKFAYVANDISNNITAYTINATSGALTRIGVTDVAAGTGPQSITTTLTQRNDVQ